MKTAICNLQDVAAESGQKIKGFSGLSMVDHPGYNLKSLLHKAFSAKGRLWTSFSRQKPMSIVVQGFQVFRAFSPE